MSEHYIPRDEEMNDPRLGRSVTLQRYPGSVYRITAVYHCSDDHERMSVTRVSCEGKPTASPNSISGLAVEETTFVD
jgi:hypothetical protein